MHYYLGLTNAYYSYILIVHVLRISARYKHSRNSLEIAVNFFILILLILYFKNYLLTGMEIEPMSFVCNARRVLIIFI